MDPLRCNEFMSHPNHDTAGVRDPYNWRFADRPAGALAAGLSFAWVMAIVALGVAKLVGSEFNFATSYLIILAALIVVVIWDDRKTLRERAAAGVPSARDARRHLQEGYESLVKAQADLNAILERLTSDIDQKRDEYESLQAQAIKLNAQRQEVETAQRALSSLLERSRGSWRRDMIMVLISAAISIPIGMLVNVLTA